jgi:hypothetical protein
LLSLHYFRHFWFCNFCFTFARLSSPIYAFFSHRPTITPTISSSPPAHWWSNFFVPCSSCHFCHFTSRYLYF